MFFRECVERDHAGPVTQQCVHGLGIGFAVAADEGVALSLTLGLRLGIGDRLEEFGCGGLGLLRQRVEDIGELVVPASLLLTSGVNLPQRSPDA